MKVKISIFGFLDMLKFKNLKKNRENLIENSPSTNIENNYVVNDLANFYHPYKQELEVDDIIVENEDVKSFILTSKAKLAPFKAGSYISIYVNINNELVSRAYSISSSPLDAYKGFYRITVKRVKGGLMSNYLLDKVKVGDKLYASEPGGFLTYNKIRDHKNVVCVAGGVGITPFISMAKAINDHVEDFNLTILYGVDNKKDIILKDDIDYLNKTDKVNIIYVFRNEEVDNYPYGLITTDLIKKYGKDDYSIFVAGPRGLLDYMQKELPSLNLKQKDIRIEQSPIYLNGEDKKYDVIVHINDEVKTIKASSNETLLQALEHNNISIRTKCHLGGCGFCRTKLIKGSYEATKFFKLKEVDKKLNFIHPCSIYPRSDMEIEVYEY